MALSPSKIITYLQCPMRYKLQYVDGMFEESTELRAGRAVHDAVERTVEDLTWQLGDWKERLWSKAERHFVDAWGKHCKTELDGDRLGEYGEMFGSYIRTLAARIDRNLKKGAGIQNSIKWALPQALEVSIRTEEPVAITGRIDEVSSVIAMTQYKETWLVDLKTGKVSDVPFKWDYWLQLQLYALMWYMREGKLPEGTALWFLSENLWVIMETTLDTINEAAAWAIYAAEEIEVESFPTCRSALCPWCVGYKGGCPVINNGGVRPN